MPGRKAPSANAANKWQVANCLESKSSVPQVPRIAPAAAKLAAQSRSDEMASSNKVRRRTLSKTEAAAFLGGAPVDILKCKPKHGIIRAADSQSEQTICSTLWYSLNCLRAAAGEVMPPPLVVVRRQCALFPHLQDKHGSNDSDDDCNKAVC